MEILTKKSNTSSAKNSLLAALFSFAVLASFSSCQRSSGCGYWGQNQKIEQTKTFDARCQTTTPTFKVIKEI